MQQGRAESGRGRRLSAYRSPIYTDLNQLVLRVEFPITAADPATFCLNEVGLLLPVVAVVAQGALAGGHRCRHRRGRTQGRPRLDGRVRLEAVRGELHLRERRGGRDRRRGGAHGGGGVLVRRGRPHQAVLALKRGMKGGYRSVKPAEEVPKWSKRWGDGFGSSEGGWRDLFYSAIKHDSPLITGALSPKKERRFSMPS